MWRFFGYKKFTQISQVGGGHSGETAPGQQKMRPKGCKSPKWLESAPKVANRYKAGKGPNVLDIAL